MLGLPNVRCLLGRHGEQAVVRAWNSGEHHQAVGGLGVSGERDKGLEDRTLGLPAFCQGKEAEEGLPERKEGTGRASWAAKWGSCMVRCCSGVKCGEDSLEGWGPEAPKPQLGSPTWGIPWPCLPGCTFLPSWLWLLPSPGFRPLSSTEAPDLHWGFLLPAWLWPGLGYKLPGVMVM